MLKLYVARKKTVAGQQIVLKFEKKGNKFIVKNFTEGDIYVGIDGKKENAVRIASLFFQVITTDTDTIYIDPDTTSEKGIEVQMLPKE